MSAPNYICRYCRQYSDASGQSCVRCGAPVDVRGAVSTSGWQKQPPIEDMARIQFGQSYCQIEGASVDKAEVAEFRLSTQCALGEAQGGVRGVALWELEKARGARRVRS